MVSEDALAAIITPIKDNLLGLNAEEMGVTLEISIDLNHVEIILKGSFPIYPLVYTWVPLLEAAIHQKYPTLSPTIKLGFKIKPHRTQLHNRGLRGVKNTIAIASGKGGVGKSTVAVNLAVALAQAGARVGILDADIYGPSIPMMLGQHPKIQQKENHYLPIQVHGIQAMSIGYLTEAADALIWRGPMLAKALLQMLNLTLWDEVDYLFIDLPPGTGDIPLSLVQKIPLTSAIVVTTPQAIATLDAQKAIQMFMKTHIDVLGVVENMAAHHCSRCGHEEAIFGSKGGEDLSDSFKLPLLGKVSLVENIRLHGDEGSPIARDWQGQGKPFMDIALKAALRLSRKPLNYTDIFPPIRVET